MPRICIVDYGVGNVASVASAFHALRETATVTRDPAELAAADGIVLPGVGAFSEGMSRLQQSGVLPILEARILQDKVPVLGICLGMQLFAQRSNEGGQFNGLGWIEGDVERIAPAPGIRVPHVGWNEVRWASGAVLSANIPHATHFYFNHGYSLVGAGATVTATVDFGRELVACVEQDNILGVQFHPEKSQSGGLRLLRNFLNKVESHRLRAPGRREVA